MLLALTSTARAHGITFIDTTYLVKHDLKYIFRFGKPTKVCKPGKLRPPLELSHFSQDKNLCVCHHIDLYIERTKPWRKGTGQLLLSYINPHRPVVTSTVSGWIIKTLSLAGVDTSTFKGHSTRSASTSKACAQGVPLKEILKRAFWSNKTTFEKKYKKDIISEGSFETKILT